MSELRPVSQIKPETTQIPNWLILRDDLTTNERMAVITLLMYAAHNESPTLATLASLLGYKSPRNVQLLLKRLDKLGIVSTKVMGCRPAIYYIYDPRLPRSNGKKRPIHDPTIMLINSTEPRPNAEKPQNHDHRIMVSPHVGGVLHSGSCVSSESEQPTTSVQPAPAAPNPPLTELAKWLFRQKVSAAGAG